MAYIQGNPIVISDNSATAFQIKEGSNNYMLIETINGSEYIAWSIAGTEAMRIDASGQTGFGVTDPDRKVEILDGGGNAQLKLSFDGTDNAQFQVDTDGNLTITPSGTLFNLAATSFRITGAGPHSFGGSTANYIQLWQQGSFTSGGGGTTCEGFAITTALTGANGDISAIDGMILAPSITTQGASEAISIISSLRIVAPNITIGTATATNAATLNITSAPTEATGINAAILINSGDSYTLGTNKWCFGDSGTYVYQVSDGILGLVSDNEVDITCTTLDINANTTNSGFMTIGTDALDTKSTLGLTINQAANDNIIFALQSSDVSHKFTDFADADTYGSFQKASATAGGLHIIGFDDTESTSGALRLSGYVDGDVDTQYGVVINSALTSGTGKTSVTDAMITMFANDGSGQAWVRPNGSFIIGSTAARFLDSKMTLGITINQGASDNLIFACQSSDVSHPFTSYADADTYYTIQKKETTGGAQISGYTSGGTAALKINAYVQTAGTDTEDSAMMFRVAESNGGTSDQAIGDDDIGFGFYNFGTTLLHINGDGSLIWDGTGGLCFAEIYAYEVGTTITISGSGVGNKVQVTAFDTNGESNNMTPDHTNDHITVVNAGRYLITVSMSIESAGGTAYVLSAGVWKNNGATQFQNVHMSRQLSGGGSDTGSTSMSGVIDVAASDTLELWIWNETNTNNVIVDDVTLTAVQIAGT